MGHWSRTGLCYLDLKVEQSQRWGWMLQESCKRTRMSFDDGQSTKPQFEQEEEVGQHHLCFLT